VSESTGRKFGPAAIAYVLALLAAAVVSAVSGASVPTGFALFGGSVPFEFVLFVLILLGVALFHHHTLAVAVTGLVAVSAYKLMFVPGFHIGHHMAHEWQVVWDAEHSKFAVGAATNLLGLLIGFALLAKFFEESKVPDWIPRILPDRGLWGGFVLLVYVWILSSFLDNIAAAMIGGVIARTAFQGRVTIGYVAAIVAASNAGGAWSVLGDTTTTMMWIDGVPALNVAHGIVASTIAILIVGVFAGMQQDKHQPILIEDKHEKIAIDGGRLFIVALILAGAIASNFLLDFPALGVWAAILLGAFIRRPAWGEVPGAAKGAAFLISLVLCASMMPVDKLPSPSWQTAFGLGFVSAVFDNIPLTKLALTQGGYDWGMLAFAVGFGGSMIWFGSSAGVAISKDYPEARNTGRYLKEGWFVTVAYIVAFLVQHWLVPWEVPVIPRKGKPAVVKPVDGEKGGEAPPK
jgi:Na+/H+ antiporter NhaD/arsenite permease-like protein